jgi:hypothetical protein
MLRPNSCAAVSTPYSQMDLTSDNFNRLLKWLHPNPEEAGREYERIRALLIRKFGNQGYASVAEMLADQTIDRVAKTLTAEMMETWVGKKEKYFYRVAYYILLEYIHRLVPEEELSDDLNVPNPDVDDEKEVRAECLEKCLQQLDDAKKELIKTYYSGAKAVKIKNREELARKHNMKVAVLRVKALRIRRSLKTCIEKCLEEAHRGREA